ncbi:lipocalin-like domain-containing protein [Galbibacter sp. EGI 63066]|uniref:lipocalin-like domain-containing protein n=1 Tax=Galbibacter sp. EGI 63066 TaxID=2993559 RepID=UPI0022492749|nr:lipocalin-like domain-containing protein [Galbibacter sp. EGI 63066]MCX2681525.1 lipocalin-like domain-containing protein [Galbibacter sp. EGI 63066]
MKKILTLTLIGFLFIGCSNDDGDTNQITGNWKLVEAKFYGLGDGSVSDGSTDYTNENIMYNFQTNGILIVSGGENAGYPSGEYEYSFEKGNSELLVKINNQNWTSAFINGKMVLGDSFADGPDLVFERK